MNFLYVSPSGSDAGDGSWDNPFLTLERACNEVENHEAFKILLREGVYEIEKPITITDADNLVITAYENENVRIVGGRILKNQGIKPVTDSKIKERLLPSVQDKVMQFDLLANNISIGKDIEAEYGQSTKVPMELFIDQKPCELSRYPRDGWLKITEILDPGEHIILDGGKRGGTFRITDERIKRWENADNMWLKGFFGVGFACEILPVEKINFGEKSIKLGINGRFGLNLREPSRDFYVFNLLEEISRPCDYFIDRKKGVLYFYPPANYSHETEVAVSVLTEPIITLVNCTHVTISNVTLEMTRGNAVQIYSGVGNSVKNCTLRNIGALAVSLGDPSVCAKTAVATIGTLTISPERATQLSQNRLQKTSRSFFEHQEGLLEQHNHFAGENHNISNCHIYDCGTGGIQLRGGYRPTLRAGGNQVHNCKIHNCNRWQRSYAPHIYIMGVGNKITHCELYEGTGNGILLAGNDHLIEYNHLHHLCTDVDDAGAFYMGYNPSEQGNVLRYNYFHHIESRRQINIPIKDGFGVFSIYVDDGGSGVTIYGNVFYRGGNWAIAINGGSDIDASNNIFIQSPNCIWQTDNQTGKYSSENMPKPDMAPNGNSPLYYEKLLDTVDITKPPYSTKYPNLATFFHDAGYPKRNKASNNVAYQCLNFITTWHKMNQLIVNPAFLRQEGESDYDVLRRYPVWYSQKNNVISSDLEFLEDWSKPDFDYINREIAKLIPEFKPIPFDEIGVER